MEEQASLLGRFGVSYLKSWIVEACSELNLAAPLPNTPRTPTCRRVPCGSSKTWGGLDAPAPSSGQPQEGCRLAVQCHPRTHHRVLCQTCRVRRVLEGFASPGLNFKHPYECLIRVNALGPGGMTIYTLLEHKDKVFIKINKGVVLRHS